MEPQTTKNQEAAAPATVVSTRDAAKTVSPEVAAMLQKDKLATLSMQARSTLRRGNTDEARAVLQQIFALSPTDRDGLELLGDIFLAEGEQEKAIAVFERGRKFHPRHLPFEEKIALAKIDQQEEELAKIRREAALQLGDTEGWRDRKPTLAAFLSLLLPGAGHVYLERYERAATYFAASVITFCGWYFTLRAALPTEAAQAALRQNRSSLAPFGAALSGLSGFSRIWFWSMILLYIATYVISAFDAMHSAKRAAQERRRELGL